jgi:uncharacterized membrane protein YfcA
MIPALIGMIVFVSLLRGSKGMDSIVGIGSCSPLDFVLLVLLLLFIVAMTAINIYIVKKEHLIKEIHGYKFVEGDLQWTSRTLIEFNLSALGAGFIASLVGLGGGVIFNPLLLSFKVQPSVASNTGMFMVMFSSITNSFLFIMAGYFHYEYGLW